MLALIVGVLIIMLISYLVSLVLGPPAGLICFVILMIIFLVSYLPGAHLAVMVPAMLSYVGAR